MSIAATVTSCVHNTGVPYRVVDHPHSSSSLQSAMSARVSSESVAKGVLLKDRMGYLLAVLPASRALSLKQLEDSTDRHMQLASETEIGERFEDCEIGAIPALGPAYGLETVVDDTLRLQPEIYIEAGDHERLLCMGEQDFEACLPGARFAHFSTRPM